MERNERRALLIDEKDTVAVVTEAAEPGDAVCCEGKGGISKRVTATEAIPIFHKIAVASMKQGEPVVKYGEHIGVAGQTIEPGQHVHTHNVVSRREEL